MKESLNRVVVSAGALRKNMAICRNHAGGADILAMVKADGYGHGMIECAQVFVEEGAAALGVAEVAEGVALRQAGFTLPVFVLAGIIPQTAKTAVEFDLVPVLPDCDALDALDTHAGRVGKKIAVHLKLDAGMGRQGTLPKDIVRLAREVELRPWLWAGGVLAHFPMADDPTSRQSDQVVATFLRAVALLKEQLSHPFTCHLANSGGLMYVNGAQFDMVRPGISLYGYYPDGEAGRSAAQEPKLEPAMRFSSRVIQVRSVDAGVGIGYGHSMVTTRPTTIAVLPMGYEDGYLRVLSNRGQVLLNGCRAPVIGRISMNLTLVDVTDVGPVRVGDEAVVLGRQGDEEITADEIAGWMGTISYEVLCLFGHMNQRQFID